MFLTTARLQHQYELPRALARDIVVEGTQQALRRRWQPWAWLFASLMLPVLAVAAGWLPGWRAMHGLAGLGAVITGCVGWSLLGQWLGGDAMLAAAAAKARRLERGRAS
jgi:hypothetical protein